MQIIYICECVADEYSVTYNSSGVSIWVDVADDVDNIRAMLSHYGISSTSVNNSEAEDDECESSWRIDVDFCLVGKLTNTNEIKFENLNYEV